MRESCSVRLHADRIGIGPAEAGHYGLRGTAIVVATIVAASTVTIAAIVTLSTATMAAIVTFSTVTMAAQVGGKLVSGGNPTPGTEQPAPPNLGDRITLSGCLRAAPKRTSTPSDPNEPSDARFVLANAERVNRVPPDTGGSSLAAGVTARAYRLAGIESQFSPFVGAKVEISGEVKSPSSEARSDESPTIIVEFVHKIDSACK